MKHLLKSLLLGLGIELIMFAVSVGLVAVGGWGPCGPAGYASLIGAGRMSSIAFFFKGFA